MANGAVYQSLVSIVALNLVIIAKKTRKHRGDTFESDVPRFASARLTKARRAMHEKYVQSGMNFSFDRNGRND
ncbi:hypothetical protein G6M50_33210 [Agrobacterium rhizogenes]|nr:hypothetical protein [Rhizobium rhizogenes]NTJ82654.1 hypothetical protein [Rhizobium rhizogenes]